MKSSFNFHSKLRHTQKTASELTTTAKRYTYNTNATPYKIRKNNYTKHTRSLFGISCRLFKYECIHFSSSLPEVTTSKYAGIVFIINIRALPGKLLIPQSKSYDWERELYYDWERELYQGLSTAKQTSYAPHYSDSRKIHSD